MSSPEVGQAYVRVRALTTGLADEIRTSVRGAVRQAASAAEVPVSAAVNRGQAESTIRGELGAVAQSVHEVVPVTAEVNRGQAEGAIRGELGSVARGVHESVPVTASVNRGQVEGEIRGEMGSAARAVHETVPIGARVNQAEVTGTMRRSFGEAARNVVAYVGGIFAAEKVFEFGKDVLGEAATVQKAQETIRQQFGQTGDALETFATGAAAQLGISTAASEQASARFGVLFHNLGIGRSRAEEMTVGFQKLVGGLAQVRDVDPTAALQALNTTLATGSTRGLRSLGVALDANAIKEEAFREGLVKSTVSAQAVADSRTKVALATRAYNQAVGQSGAHSAAAEHALITLHSAQDGLKTSLAGTSGQLTITQKDEAIYGLVTKDLGRTLDEAKQHSGDLANQQKVLSAEWANAKASIGEALLPAVTSLARGLVQVVTVIRENRTEFVALALGIGSLGGAYFAAEIGQRAYRSGSAALSAATKILSGDVIFETGAQRAKAATLKTATLAQRESIIATELAEGATAAQAAVTADAAVEQEGLNAAVSLNPYTIAAVAIAGLVAGTYELYQHSSTVRTVVREVAGDLRGALSVGAGIAGGALRGAASAAEALGGFLGRHTTEVRAFGVAVGVLAGVLIAVEAASVAAAAGTAIYAAATEGVAVAVRVFTAATEAQTVAQAALDVVMDANPVVLVGLAIAALAAGLYELYERSATARHIMQEVGGAIRSGLGDAARFVSETALPALEGAIHRVEGVLGGVAGTVTGAGGGLFSGLLGGGEAAVGAARSVAGGIEDAIGGLVSGVEAGVAVVRAVWGAIAPVLSGPIRLAVRLVRADVGDVIHIVEDVVSLVGDVIHGRWGAAWHDFTDIIGTYIGLGIRLLLGAPAVVLSAALSIGEAVVDGVRHHLSALPGVVWGFVRQVAGSVERGAERAAGAALSLARGIIRAVAREGERLPGQVWGFIRRIPAAELRGLQVIEGAALRLGRAILGAIVREGERLPGQVWGFIRQVPGAVLRGLGVIGGAASHIGREILSSIVGFVNDVPGRVAHFLEQVPGRIRQVAGDVASAAADLGRRIVRGAISGVESLGGDLKDSIESHVKGALSSLNPFSPVEEGASRYIGSPILAGALAGAQPLNTQLRAQVSGDIVQALGVVHDRAAGWARPIGQGVRGGIVSGAGGLQAALGSSIVSALHGALNQARAAFGIHSPSSVYAERLGRPLRDGIVRGLGGLQAELVRRVQGSVNAAAAVGVGPLPPYHGAQGELTPTQAQSAARSMLHSYGWSPAEFAPLVTLWNQESGWRWNAQNPSSGAYGIPQSLPASKMASVGADYLTNAITQMRWGLGYIKGRYGSPSGAEAHERAFNWYDRGGWLPPGLSLALNETGRSERVLSPRESDRLERRPAIEQHFHVPAETTRLERTRLKRAAKEAVLEMIRAGEL